MSEENENIQFQLTDELIERVELFIEEENNKDQFDFENSGHIHTNLAHSYMLMNALSEAKEHFIRSISIYEEQLSENASLKAFIALGQYNR